MATRQYRPSKLKRLILPGLTALFLAYFTYHAFHGAYGLEGRAQLDARASQLSAELARLSAERENLETRVVMMRPASLDQDLTDERAREALNLVGANEMVIFLADR